VDLDKFTFDAYGFVKSAGALLFNASCNNQVFFSKSWKQFRANPCCPLWEKRRTAELRHTRNPKNDVTEPKARL